MQAQKHNLLAKNGIPAVLAEEMRETQETNHEEGTPATNSPSTLPSLEHLALPHNAEPPSSEEELPLEQGDDLHLSLTDGPPGHTPGELTAQANITEISDINCSNKRNRARCAVSSDTAAAQTSISKQAETQFRNMTAQQRGTVRPFAPVLPSAAGFLALLWTVGRATS